VSHYYILQPLTLKSFTLFIGFNHHNHSFFNLLLVSWVAQVWYLIYADTLLSENIYRKSLFREKHIHKRRHHDNTYSKKINKTQIIVTSACLEGRKKKGLMHMHAYKPVNWIYPNRRKPSKYTLCGYTKISTSSVSISTKRCKSNAVSTLGVQQRVAKVMQFEIVVHCYNTSLFFSSCNRGFFTKCYSTIQLPASCSES